VRLKPVSKKVVMMNLNLWNNIDSNLRNIINTLPKGSFLWHSVSHKVDSVKRVSNFIGDAMLLKSLGIDDD
jgi:hypothetical protein